MTANTKKGLKSQVRQRSLLDMFPRKPRVADAIIPSSDNGLVADSDSNVTADAGQLKPPLSSQIDVQPEPDVDVDLTVSAGQDQISETVPIAIPEHASNDVTKVVPFPPTSSVGTRSEPIIVESSPPPLFQNGSFSDAVANASSISNSVSSSSASHTKAATKTVPQKAVYSIFKPRPSDSSSKKDAIKPTTFDAPFPDRTNQHVLGPQSSFPKSKPIIPRKRKGRTNDNSSVLHPWARYKSACPLNKRAVKGTILEDTGSDYLSSLPDEHRRAHPSVDRVLSTSRSSKANEAIHTDTSIWNHKYRPTRAEETLSNEEASCYLRDWLQALSLQLDEKGIAQSPIKTQNRGGKRSASAKGVRANKRPHIIRAVAKRRGRKKQRIDSDAEDSWIADSDESEEDGTSDDGESFDNQDLTDVDKFTQRSSSSFDYNRAPTKFDTLSNTILLHGPTGCGKTASVYACAEELGWDVFEVYPGIGRRNGANLELLIGDVARNHIVCKTQLHRDPPVSKASNSIDALLPKNAKLNLPFPTKGTGSEDFGFLRSSHGAQSPGESTRDFVRQSIILLEEVDILFKEDQGFWSAVVNLIRDSKRPVVLTCNDVSVVPIEDLPLQRLLEFRSPHVPVATSYLQTICHAEGHFLDRNLLTRIYQNTLAASEQTYDLRRSIHQLQFLCLGLMADTSSVPHEGSLLQDTDLSDRTIATAAIGANLSLVQQLEWNSALDYIASADSATKEAETTADLPDEEIGHNILPLQSDSTVENTFAPVTSASDESAFDPQSDIEYTSDTYNFRTDITHFARNEAFPELFSRLKPASLFLDYLPYVRHIVTADDAQLSRTVEDGAERLSRLRRATRNNPGYIRAVPLSAEAREILQRTSLVNS